MKTFVLILGMIQFSLFSLSQNKHIKEMNDNLDIRGADEKNLIIADNESYKSENHFSEYYIDSINGKAYSGIITIDYNGNYLDSINTLNGLKNGLSKHYKTKDTIVLDHIDYYDQTESIFISRSFPFASNDYTKKNKFNYLWIRFYSEQVYIRFHCIKKKTCLVLRIYENDKKKTVKISNIENLKKIIGQYKSDVDIVELLFKIDALTNFE
jgi:hypothetical protein